MLVLGLAPSLGAQSLPAPDGWESEAFGQRAHARLIELANAAFMATGDRDALLAGLVDADFTCGVLRPEKLVPLGPEGGLRVSGGAPTEGEPTLLAGPVGLAQGLVELFAPFGAPPRIHFKVVSTEPRGLGGSTRALLEVEGTGTSGVLQLRATWQCEWSAADASAPLQLEALVTADFREAARADALFADVTESVLGSNTSFEAQLLPSLETWRGRLDGSLGVTRLGHQGFAIGDVDGDGLEDLYLCQPGGLPNLLYRRRPDGTAEDISAEAGVDFLDLSRSALLVDLDGDQDLDLALGVGTQLALLQNDGSGHFAPRRSITTPGTTSLAAADYDLDGDLDLYVCSYVDPYHGDGAPLPYHDAENGAVNLLLRNNGEWRFADVASDVGLDANNSRFSFAASWEDFDNDGDADLYVANDFGRNNLYENDEGRFRDIAGDAGVEDLSAGMGVAWGDVDEDGRFDLYVSNMFSSAGQRVAYQRQFHEGSSAEALAQFRRHARGNSLFLNAGDGSFRDVSEEAGVTRGRWSWGSIFSDFNGDGRLDIVVPNGFLTSELADDL